jgi:segregation and condensation protein A
MVAVGPGRPDDPQNTIAELPAIPPIFFGEGRRPEATTRVQLPAFDGPLGLLLALIEANRLDVLTVPLGTLAGGYLEALATLEADRLGNVSAFVAVASQLILIKSRAMLPRHTPSAATDLADEGADPEAELRARLILYRAYRDAGIALLASAQLRVGLFRREPSIARAAGLAGARPPAAEALDPDLLEAALVDILRLVAPPAPPPELLARTITLAERASVIREALRGARTVVLQELLVGVRDRVVMAVTFLAMLELMKRHEIVVEQAEPWGPIVARATTPAERALAGLAPGSEDAPLDESLESFT